MTSGSEIALREDFAGVGLDDVPGDASSLWRKEAPTAIGLLVPFGVECPSVAVGLAFCDACAADRPERELGMAMVARLRAGPLPGLRIFSPMPQAGHA
jgi:hypothetical protein